MRTSAPLCSTAGTPDSSQGRMEGIHRRPGQDHRRGRQTFRARPTLRQQSIFGERRTRRDRRTLRKRPNPRGRRTLRERMLLGGGFARTLRANPFACKNSALRRTNGVCLGVIRAFVTHCKRGSVNPPSEALGPTEPCFEQKPFHRLRSQPTSLKSILAHSSKHPSSEVREGISAALTAPRIPMTKRSRS